MTSKSARKMRQLLAKALGLGEAFAEASRTPAREVSVVSVKRGTRGAYRRSLNYSRSQKVGT